MPEVRFHIQWPDGQQESCYSPSLIIKDYFQVGESYTINDFLQRSRESLQIASDRVKAKYGFPCGLALGQLQKIEDTAQHYLEEQPDSKVTILQFK